MTLLGLVEKNGQRQCKDEKQVLRFAQDDKGEGGGRMTKVRVVEG
jgi:hypothetical protein